VIILSRRNCDNHFSQTLNSELRILPNQSKPEPKSRNKKTSKLIRQSPLKTKIILIVFNIQFLPRNKHTQSHLGK
jgi:hypothetical protein